jgi:PAS domain S-box-containing protein
MSKVSSSTREENVARHNQDVSDLKFAEAEALFTSIGEGAFVTDVNGKISRVNPKAVEILGFRADELIGQWFPNIIIGEDEDGRVIPNSRRPIYEIFITGEPIFRKMYYVRRDNTRVAVAVTVSPIMMNGRPIGAIEMFRDISEEVRLERAKDEFIALASHQLRTPATAVKQYAAMLLDGYVGEVTDQQREMLNKIYESNERQITTINDLLRVAQIDAGRMSLSVSEVDLNKLISDVINEQMAKFQSRSQEVDVRLSETPVWVAIDQGRFRMALENLIDNASKYTPDGKSIHVRLGRQKGRIVIEVRDEGVGIPRDEYLRIFEKFSRIDNPLSISVGGTGLGLYWVQKILDLHRAKINVRSKVNVGTTFTIYLPQ